jgi:hypothetical protein
MLDSLGQRWPEGFFLSFFFFSHFPWSYGPSITSGSSDVVSPGDWLVSSIWFLLSTGQVVIGASGNSLPVHARYSELLFHQEAAVLSYSCNCIWLAPPPATWSNSVLSTALSFMRPAQGGLGGLLVTPPPLSAFVPCLTSALC